MLQFEKYYFENIDISKSKHQYKCDCVDQCRAALTLCYTNSRKSAGAVGISGIVSSVGAGAATVNPAVFFVGLLTTAFSATLTYVINVDICDSNYSLCRTWCKCE